MVIDDSLVLRTVAQSATAVTSSDNDTSAVRVLRGFDLVPMWIRFDYFAAAVGSSTGTAIFKSRISADDSTYYDSHSAAYAAVALSTTATKGTIFVPVMASPDVATKLTYVKGRVSLTGTGATIKYTAYLVDGPNA